MIYFGTDEIDSKLTNTAPFPPAAANGFFQQSTVGCPPLFVPPVSPFVPVFPGPVVSPPPPPPASFGPLPFGAVQPPLPMSIRPHSKEAEYNARLEAASWGAQSKAAGLPPSAVPTPGESQASLGSPEASKNPFCKGAVVVLQNLKTADLNGRRGVLDEFDFVSGRWRVQVDGCLKSFKVENLNPSEEVFTENAKPFDSAEARFQRSRSRSREFDKGSSLPSCPQPITSADSTPQETKTEGSCENQVPVSPPKNSGSLCKGDFVTLHGLKTAGLNGRFGILDDVDAASGRWHVQVDGCVKSFKEENLKRIESVNAQPNTTSEEKVEEKVDDAGSGVSLVERLKQAKVMLDNGLITLEDYNAVKAKFLDKITEA